MKQLTSLIFFVLFAFQLGWAQEIDSSLVNSSPYYTIYNHLFYLQPENYDPYMAARSLYPNHPKKGEDAAVKLKEILDGKGLFVDLNRLPVDQNFVDSIQRESIYIISKNEPRIYVERKNGRWVYSKTTLNALDDMYSALYPFNGSVRSFFDANVWHASFLHVQLWQWTSLLLLIVVALLFFGLIYWLMRRVGHRLAHLQISTKDQISDSISKLTKVVSLLLTFILVHYLLPAVHLLPKLNAILIKSIEVMQIVFVILIIVEIVHLIFSYLNKWASQTNSTMDDQLVPLLSRLADIIIWAVGVIYVLDYLEINVTALLAGISIGGLAIALAAQDTVKHFFGSVMIFLDKPFQIGDWISFDGVDGVVESVGVRSTRIRTFANSLTYVPNGIFAEKIIDNKGLRIFRRYTTEVGITYDTPTYLIDLYTEGIEDLIRHHPFTRKDSFEVKLNKFESSSLNILVYAFFTVDNWTDELRGKHDLMKGMINLAEALGVRFAFPSQTLYIEQMPGKDSLIPLKISKENAQVKAKEALARIKGEFVSLDEDHVGPKNLGGE